MKSNFRYRTLGVLLIAGAVILSGVAYASHSWANYHWARAVNPFTLKLGDNVSTTWDAFLAQASSDWSKSTVLDTTVVTGGTRPKPCKATAGQIEACSASYGNNGWLGVASIWVSGSHIVQGTVKVNDYYFNTPTYNTTGWRSLVMCQEIGHTFGLGHQDENFNNEPITPHTCMDYFIPDSNEVVSPNQHDYDQLETIYNGHLDSSTTVGQTLPPGSRGHRGFAEDLEDPAQWGKIVKYDAAGKPSLYERDLGNGKKVFTFVIWTR